MLKIRLQRVGRKHDPSYRLVVTDSRKAPQGAYLEMLGSYNPRTDNKTLNNERISYWLSNGAQASDTAYNLLISEKLIEGKKRDVSSKKNVGKKEAEAEAKAKAEAEALAKADATAKAEADALAKAADEAKAETKDEPSAEKKEETPVEESTPKAD